VKDEVTQDDDEGKEKSGTKEPKEKTNEKEEEEGDECPICLEILPKDATQFVRWSCCGNGMHMHCDKDLHSMKMDGTCPLCRAKTPSSHEEIVKQLHPWVKKKKAWAMSLMGEMYRDGTGVKQSYEMARMLYEQAAQQGDTDAIFSLGEMYYHGGGVEQSYEKAKEYYEQAADLGYASAMYNLGIMYDDGFGVEQSYEKAKEYYEQSADLGCSDAQCALGFLYATGQGVTKDESKAKTWWTASAAQGHEKAMENLKILEMKMKQKMAKNATKNTK
jgi:TPR repeat protein